MHKRNMARRKKREGGDCGRWLVYNKKKIDGEGEKRRGEESGRNCNTYCVTGESEKW